MAATYDIAKRRARDRIRLAIGDTVPARARFQDEDLDAILDETATRHAIRVTCAAAAGLTEASFEVAAGTSSMEARTSRTVDSATTYADLAIDASDAKVLSSAASPFTSGDVGKKIRVTGGAGFTAGRYLIASVAGGEATVTADVGATGSTGGTGVLADVLATTYALRSLDYDTVGELVDAIIANGGGFDVALDDGAFFLWLLGRHQGESVDPRQLDLVRSWPAEDLALVGPLDVLGVEQRISIYDIAAAKAEAERVASFGVNEFQSYSEGKVSWTKPSTGAARAGSASERGSGAAAAAYSSWRRF